MIRRWLDTLLHIEDTPERTAAAFALGVFFGFSPFLGLHTLLGDRSWRSCSNLNRVAVLLGVYSNLPWIIACYYAFTTMIGAAITGPRLPPGFRERLGELFELSALHGEFWQRAGHAALAAALAVHGRLAARRRRAGRRSRIRWRSRLCRQPHARLARTCIHHES